MSQVALVTGCSEPASLGAAIARELLRRGYTVFATARNFAHLASLEAEGCKVLQLDVTMKDSIEAAATEVRAKYGRLDVLINNAGVAGMAPLLDTDNMRFAAMMEVNVMGILAVTRGFMSLLVDTAAIGLQPVVLNVGSVAARPSAFMGAYGATKAAAMAVSDGLRLELRPLGIRVVTLELGGVKTRMIALENEFELTKPESISGYYPNTVEILAASGRDDFVKKSYTPEVTALRIVNAVTKRNPPAKTYAGLMGWFFYYIAPLLPISWLDHIFTQVGKLHLIPKPQSTTSAATKKKD